MAHCFSCGEQFSDQRLTLGYNTCLACGDFAAREVRWTTAPLNKGNYVLITNREELKMLNPKRIGE